MKSFLLPLFVLLTSYVVEAQKTKGSTEEVSLASLKMKVYSGDTSAAAVILFEKGSAVLSAAAANGLTYKRHVRIKIFRREAFDEWANVNLLVERGSVFKLKAVTYNLVNDSIVKSEIDDTGVFKKRFNKYIDEIKFTLPNVKEGSIIEYDYLIRGEMGVPQWEFQHTIPSLLSEYAVKVPNFVTMRHNIRGLISPLHKEENKMDVWAMKNIPAFKSEPYMPNKNDFISSIDFIFSYSTWESISARLLEDQNFGGTINEVPFLKKHAEEATAGVTETKEKIIAIHKYVKDHLEWNGVEDIYAADDLKDNFRKKTGTAADINLIMASMLHKVGIRVEMVLLSTRGNGFARMDNPTTRQFNYTICRAYIDTVGYFLDATEKYLPWNVLPERCMNGIALVISEKRYSWVDIDSYVKARTVATSDLVLSEDGELNGKFSYTRSGYDAHQMRREFYEKGKDRYLADFAKAKQWNIVKSEFLNLENVDQSAVEQHEISLQEHGTEANGLIYINPFITFNEDENPFKADKREFPIDFAVRSEKMYVANITIPDGYIVDEMPDKKLVLLQGNKGKFSYSVTQTGNRITVVSSIQISNRLFMQDEYPSLREFYNRVVAKHAEQIVLKRK
jgi:hypothetical protein